MSERPATATAPRAAPIPGPRPDPGRAPALGLPLGYLGAAVVALLAAGLALPWLGPDLAGHYYQPRVMALTHTVALGWVTLAILGASYQLVPVVLERRLWSERLARWQLPVLGAGLAGLVGHFAVAHWAGMIWAAGLVVLGGLAHLLNLGLTLRRLARWGFTARLIAAAHLGLALTLAFGLLLAALRAAGATAGDALGRVHAHFHLALLGWIAPMILGVAARVFPMFFLAAEPGPRNRAVQALGLALGVPVLVAGLLALPPLVLPGAGLAAAALAAHGAWVLALARRRRRPALDWGLRFVLTGAACLLPAGLLGLALAAGWLAGPRAALAYAVLALGGWVSLTVAGMMLKIVPFLVWQRVYAPRAGRGPVPTLARLGWPAAEGVAYGLLTTGVVGLALAALAGTPGGLRLAGAALALGAATLAATLGRVLAHLRARPAGAPATGSPR